MSVIDRGELHWALDENRPFLSRTFNAWYNFQGAAADVSADQILTALDAASNNNAEVATFTRTLRENPELAATFRTQMINEGRDVVSEVNALIEREGALTQAEVLSFMENVSAEVGQYAFDDHVNYSVDTPAEFFEFVTTDNYVTRAFSEEAYVENSIPQLSVFADDAEFQQALFDAAHQPGFFEYMRTFSETSGATAGTLEAMLSTPEGREAVKAAVQNVANDEFNGDYNAAFSPVTSEAAMTALEILARQYPGAEGVLEIVQSDPALEAAFRDATSDPTFIPGITRMLEGGESNFNISDLEAALQDETTRGHLTRILERVAEGTTTNGLDVNFEHVRQIMEAQKNGDRATAARIMQEIGALPDGADALQLGMQFFVELMQDPERAVYNLVNGLQEQGLLTEQHANILMSFAPEIAGFAHFMAEPIHGVMVENNVTMDTIRNIPNARAAIGAERMAEYEERFETVVPQTGLGLAAAPQDTAAVFGGAADGTIIPPEEAAQRIAANAELSQRTGTTLSL